MRVFVGRLDSFRRGGMRVAAVLMAFAVSAPAAAQANPDFDAVAWTPVGCAATDLVRHTTPAGVDLAGDASFAAVYLAHDADYAYFRYRVDGDPSGPGGFAQYSWTALMQVPSGDPYEYQYQLSLNGKDDTIEVWANTTASPIDFSPLFQDTSEVLLFAQPYALADGSTTNTTPLARMVPAGDGSSFGNNPDWFLDVAFPVTVLVAHGVIADAAELDGTLYFPATSTNPNNYNKSTLNCPFLPDASLSLEAVVAPALLPANATTPLAYTLTVRNIGADEARGVVVGGSSLPAYMTGAVVTVASSDPGVTWTVMATNPLEVRVPELPIGAVLTVELAADAAPDCGDGPFTNHASAFATNASEMLADAAVDVGGAGTELCDGVDNDCDGTIDDGGAVSCDDGNACTVDACVAGACSATPVNGCIACVTGSDCDDGDACTLDVCAVGGVCEHQAAASCAACTADADCDDGDACTSEQCSGGGCVLTVTPACTACTTDAGCDDADACTTDTCTGGVCAHGADPTCVPTEICGDCLDNDGDGLVDYEDDACCQAHAVLEVRRMRLNGTPGKVRGNRLRVKARRVAFDAATLDPMQQDTTLQISDGAGTVFCRTIAAEHWTHRRARIFRFKDKAGAFAGGLRKGAFKVRKDGRIVFGAKGKQVALPSTSGQAVTVTLRVGAQCSQMQLGLHARRRVERGLVFP